MEGELNTSVMKGLGMLLGGGVPLVILLLVREIISNIVAGIQIKMNSNFQYINCFEFEGRKKCRIVNIHPTTVEIQDMQSNQTIIIFNREFMKAKIWRNIDRAKRDT